MRGRRRAQSGFTLVELMVSLVLFSFAIAGVLAIAVSMAQGFREQRQIVETETTARNALDFIADAVRMASPGVADGVLTNQTSSPDTLTINPATNRIVEDTMGLAGTCPTGTIRVFNNAGLNSSDILDVVFASGPVVTSLKGTWTKTSTTIDVHDATSLAAGDTLLLTNGSDGRLVRVADVIDADTVELETPTCNVTDPVTTTCGAGTYCAGTLVLRALRARFYLDDLELAAGITTTLYMDPDADGALDPEPLADWVEDFQVAVGIDTDADRTITEAELEYSPAAAGTTWLANGTEGLHTVRLSLVARAAGGLVATTASYLRPALEDHVGSTAVDTFRRRVLRTTVEIRNLEDSP